MWDCTGSGGHGTDVALRRRSGRRSPSGETDRGRRRRRRSRPGAPHRLRWRERHGRAASSRRRNDRAAPPAPPPARHRLRSAGSPMIFARTTTGTRRRLASISGRFGSRAAVERRIERLQRCRRQRRAAGAGDGEDKPPSPARCHTQVAWARATRPDDVASHSKSCERHRAAEGAHGGRRGFAGIVAGFGIGAAVGRQRIGDGAQPDRPLERDRELVGAASAPPAPGPCGSGR